MKSYNDLPMLVMAKILAFASNGADGDLIKWKKALPLLSVCHNCRVYGKHHLYRYAIIIVADPGLPLRDFEELDCTEEVEVTYMDSSDNESDNSDDEAISYSESSALMPVNPVVNVVAFDDRGPIRIYTNITLIEKLGLESMVKQLLFGESRFQNFINEVDPLKYFIPFLQVLVDGLPEETKLTKPFAEWHKLEHINMELSNRLRDQCYAASHEVVNILINKYPNVSSISAAMVKPHEFMQMLILELAVGYDKQLSKLVCDMPVTYSYTLTAPNLIELDLKLYRSLYQNLPTICPGSLQKINLVLDNMPFSWDMFRVDNESKVIAFDNLEVLSIRGKYQGGFIDHAITTVDIDLEFPKLERLYLKHSRLTRKEAQIILGHGLKQLHFEGSIVAASQLCEQPLGNLDRLDLVWQQDRYLNEPDYFVTFANRIFNNTDCIERVHCHISAAYYTWSTADVNWPYLTHLSLNFMIPFDELFDMLQNVLNLVHLDMNITGWIDNEYTETTELFTNIKKHYPEPSSSKIRTLHLVDRRIIPRREFYCELPFVKAIKNLKWYWPQLKNIDIQCEVDKD